MDAEKNRFNPVAKRYLFEGKIDERLGVSIL